MRARSVDVLAATRRTLFAATAASMLTAAILSIGVPALSQRERDGVVRWNDPGRLLALATAFISQKRYGDAIEILEPLTEQYPDMRAAAERLAICYQETGRPRDAVRLLEERISLDPHHLPFARELGNAYLDLGERDRALEAWHSVLDDDPKRAGYYGTIAQLEKEAGLYEEALSTYRAGRGYEAFFKQYTTEIIRLERLLGRTEVAFEEAVSLIAQSPRFNAADIDLAVELYAEGGREESLLEFVDSTAAHRESPDIMVLKTVLLVDAGRYDEAVEHLERLGSSGERETYSVVGYLVRARRRGTVSGNDPVLRKALETFLRDHGSSAVAPGVMFVLAEDLRSQAAAGAEREAALGEALDMLDRILEHPKCGFYREPALLLEAEILLDELHRADGAIEALAGAEFREEDKAREAERIIMRALIEARRWEEAERRFSILSGDPDSVKAAVGRYGMGKMHFHRGEYGAAVDSLSRFAESHPWSEFANDALETAMLIREALTEDRAALDCYRGGYVALDGGRVGEAADSLDAFRQRHPLSLLIPRVLFMRGETYMISGDLEAAAGIWVELADRYPLHELAPRALERAAELAGPGESMELYETIIERYPDDPFIGRIRNSYIAARKSAEEASDVD